MQLIVLGMHRSGTSLAARLLNMMGAYFSPPELAMQPTEDNRKGYWERTDVWHLNDRILNSVGASWHDIADFEADALDAALEKKFAPELQKIIYGLDANRPWMLKDPRLCLLLPLWKRFLEMPVAVIVHREPLQVAQSLQVRETAAVLKNDGEALHYVHHAGYLPQGVDFPITLGIALWEKYTLHSLAASAGMPRIPIAYQDLIKSPVETVNSLYQALQGYGVQGLRLPSEQEICAYIDPALYRRRGTQSEQEAYLNQAQAKLVRALRSGKTLNQTVPAMSPAGVEILREHRDKLLGGKELCRRQDEIITLRSRLQQSQNEAESLKLSLQAAEQDINALREARQQAQEAFEALQVRQEQTRDALEASEEARRALDKENTKRAKHIEEQDETLRKQAETLAAWGREREEQANYISVLREYGGKRKQQVEQMVYWNNALKDDIKAVFSSVSWRGGHALTSLLMRLMLKNPGATAEGHVNGILQHLQQLAPLPEFPEPGTSPQNSAHHSQPPQPTPPSPVATGFPRLTLPTVEEYEKWYALNRCSKHELSAQRREVEMWDDKPVISVLIPLYNSPVNWLKALLKSLAEQTYSHWECILVDDCSPQNGHLGPVRQWCDKDARFRLIQHDSNQGVGGASQTAVENAKGDYWCVVDHDDLLEPQALYEMAKIIRAKHPDVIYSDEMLVDEAGKMIRCEFRPDFNYSFLLSHPYIVHLTLFKREVMEKAGGFERGSQVSQDYDVLLRVTVQTRDFYHIPKVLYRWRTHTSSTGHQQMQQVMENSLASINRHLQQSGFDKEQAWAEEGMSFNFFRVRHAIEAQTVSIIIPTRDRLDLLRTCIQSIETLTRLPDGVKLEIVVADNDSQEKKTLDYFRQLKNEGHKVVPVPGEFNFSVINNTAVAQSSGDMLLFMNNDIEVVEEDWLEAMLEPMGDKQTGVVGAKLLYPEIGLIQHAGVILGIHGPAAHDHQFYPERENNHFAPGHNHGMLAIRECSAVTAACAMVRRSIFDRVGGFDEKLHVGFGDTDLCLRIREAGYACLFTPYARLIHHESASRGYHAEDSHPVDTALFKKRWRAVLEAGDPFYNPNLARKYKTYQPELEQPVSHVRGEI